MATLGLNRPQKVSLESIRERRKNNSLEDQEQAGMLNVSGMEEGYYYHVVNDKHGKVEKMQRRGYDVVEANGTIQMGDANPEETGTAVRATCDKTEGTKAVLMRIPQEFKDEDDQFRQTKVDQTEEAMYQKEEDEVDAYGKARYGNVKRDNPS